MELVLDNAKVRDWRPADAPSLAHHANNIEIWRNLRDGFPHPYTLACAEDWLRATATHDPTTSFAIEVDGSAAGGVGFALGRDVHRCSAEIGFWLGERFWGRGVMTGVVAAITPWAFDRYDLCRIQASIYEWNTASMRVLDKAGYVREACLRKAAVKDGRTIDLIVYAAVRE